MADAGRARGRARGRGRAEPTPSELAAARRPGEAPPPGFPAPSAAGAPPGFPKPPGPPASAWGGRPAAPPSVRPAQPATPQVTAPSAQITQATASLATMQIGGVGVQPQGKNGNGNGNGASVPAGRGAQRGRLPRSEGREVVMRTINPGFSKKGSVGRPVDLFVNYFKVSPLQQWNLLQYRVDFSPDIDHLGVRKALLYNHERELGAMLFDGTMIFMPKRLPDSMELVSVLRADNSPVKITIKRVGEVTTDDHHYQQVLNLVLRRCLEKLDLVMWNRNYYDKLAAQQIPGFNLTVWPGYITSIRHHEQSLMLCCEISHRVLREERASDVMAKHLRHSQEAAVTALLGEIVMTRYNNKTYRIDDIDWTKTPATTFELRKEKRMISYADYYRERYNLVTRDLKQPLLVSKPKDRDRNRGDDQPVYLIPEFAYMTGLSDEMRKDFKTMEKVGNVTRLRPDRRIEALRGFSQRMTSNPAITEHLKQWGLQFGRDLERIQGRVFEPERIIFGAGREVPASREADWTKEMRGKQFLATMRLVKLAIVYPKVMEAEVNEFLGNLTRVANMGLEINIASAARFPLENDRTQSYVAQLTNIVPKGPEFVLTVLRSQRADTYSAIKKLLVCDNGIPNQVVTGRILKKGLSPATKVYIQMACKLGCEPWRVKVPMSGVMVIGFDTYHDKGQKRGVGAFIASINQSLTQYCSTVVLHGNNEELCSKIGVCMRKSLMAYQKANNALPDKIFFYRDGVGSGDVPYVKLQEIATLRQAFAATSPDYNPKLAVILVNKRLNTRIMLSSNPNPDNPPPGTVVDDVITLPERYDFFLVSQYVTQGTVSPTGYNVIEDTVGLPAERLQQLTYKLTHLYYNWQGTLRVPAPCQYAHKLAYLVGESLHAETHPGLACLPYYL